MIRDLPAAFKCCCTAKCSLGSLEITDSAMIPSIGHDRIAGELLSADYGSGLFDFPAPTRLKRGRIAVSGLWERIERIGASACRTPARFKLSADLWNGLSRWRAAGAQSA